MLRSLKKFSELIFQGNVWRSVWRICMWILGLKGSSLVWSETRKVLRDPAKLCTQMFLCGEFRHITPPEKGYFKEMAQNGQQKRGYLFYDLYSLIHNNCIFQSWKSMKQVALKLLVWKAEQSKIPSFPPLHNRVAEFYTLPAKAG